MKVIWTIEQVAGLAPTNHLLKTSRSFVLAEKWLMLSQDGQVAWGIFPLSKGKDPVQTSVRLTNLNFSCSCASRSFPCAHGLGLLQLINNQPSHFILSDAPDWVTQWQQDVQKRIELQRKRDTAVPPPHHQQKQLAAIQTGLAELELWLHDLVRNGLAAARHKPKKYWFTMADRMIDAKATGIAAELRQWAAMPTEYPAWAETILRRISRLYLLIQGVQQFDMLTPEVQADLQTAVSRQTRGAALSIGHGIRDRWHILGQETEQSGRRYVQSIWLWGERSNRAAKISHITHGQRHKNFSLVIGTVLDAKLKFHVGPIHVRAQIIERFDYCQPEKPASGYDSIQAAVMAFNQALAANPWLNQFPTMVSAVPIHDGKRWRIQDESGSNLLLPTHYKRGWHLLALSSGRPLPIFGLFDGRTLIERMERRPYPPLTHFVRRKLNRWLELTRTALLGTHRAPLPDLADESPLGHLLGMIADSQPEQALLQMVGTLEPDCVLIEGPPDANEILHWLSHPDMEPPVSLLIYRPEEPKKSGFYPYALFSPELQAIRFAQERQVPVSFMDLPQGYLLGLENRPQMPDAADFKTLAQAAGHKNHEPWWNLLVEQRQDGRDLFAAILADLPLVEVEVAWVPWTYGRLSTFSGYGAGILSPGWYHHLWNMGQAGASPTESSINWLTQVANLLRNEGQDASSAHIIEAVRLADALAAMRDLPFPGLPELNEATQTVICFGDAKPMKLIQKKLIVSEGMGAVPPDTPMVPLQRDLHIQQKRLRLRPEPTQSSLNLDLRIDSHLQRSHLLHRLALLGIPWGQPMRARGNQGTYREVWRLQWLPDFAIRVIEANLWGNTVADAAAGFAEDAADRAADLPTLTKLLDQIILAELPDVIHHLMAKIEERAALSSDVPHLMGALPPLARVLRYGSVRQTDKGMIRQVVNGLLTRICVGLPSTCASMDDAAAAEMVDRVTAVHDVVRTLQNEDHTEAWHKTLVAIADQKGTHELLVGLCVRLLLNVGAFDREETAVRMERALSVRLMSGKEIEQLTQMAAWLEGFLKGSGLLVLHDQTLWQLLDEWLNQLEGDCFQDILPLLRRTFADFPETIRQQILERVKLGGVKSGGGETAVVEFDTERADTVLPLVAQLLGLEKKNDTM